MTIKTEGRERLRKDIGEAFEFARFLIKNPRTLRTIKSGSVIRLVPADCGRLPAAHKPSGRVQAFAAQTIFRSLS